MKKKNLVKIFVIVLVTLLIASTISFADYSPKTFKKEIDTAGEGTEKVKDVGGQIVGLIQVVGTIVAVGMLIVLGIKYMMGSAEERAEYKKTLFPYLIGAVLIFAAANLTQMIYNWAINLK